MFRRVVMAVLALSAWLVVVPGAAPTAAAERTLVIDPAEELGNEVVAVSWSGFRPTVDGLYTVTIMQCAGELPSSLADCYQVFRPPGTSDDNGSAVPDGLTGANGTGQSVIEVRPALQLPVLDCTASQPCSLVAFENDGSDYPDVGLPPTAAVAAIHFARSPADCPPVTTYDVTTSGEASASQALYGWSARTCTGTEALHVDYTESSSVDGRENFLSGLVQVGIASGPAEAAAASASARAPRYAPIDLTGVVVAFNVFDSVTGQRITDMNLTPRLVAMMVGGGQFGGPGETLFSDSEFLAINAGHNWPSTTKPPLLRAERNDDTSLLTRWLDSDAAARRFLDGDDATATVDPAWLGIDYPTDVFEARNESTLGSYNPRSGTTTNARRLFNLQAPGDGQVAVPSFEGLLGVLDAVTARRFGLPTARLRPASASTDPATDTSGFVAADALGLSAGFEAMQSDDATGTRAADVASPTGYPLTKIDYAMVPTAGESVAAADHIASFVEYASEAGQAPDVLSEGYLALPDQLRDQAAEVASAVRTGGSDDPPSGPNDPGFLPPDLPFDPGGLDDGGIFDPDQPLGELPPGDVVDPGASPDSSGPTDGPGGGEQDAAALPISSFAGGDSETVLPILLAVGLGAVLVGPGLLWWSSRRRTRPAGRRP